LTRAALTAETIHSLQPDTTALLKIAELREQDFGLFEGVAYSAYGGPAEDPRRASVETTDEMAVRARSFIAEYFMPVVQGLGDRSTAMALVSHGCMLRVIWRELLAHLKPSSVQCEQAILLETQSIDHMRLGPWSNTGYLQVDFSRSLTPVLLTELHAEQSQLGDTTPKTIKMEAVKAAAPTWSARILAINETSHLKALVRTKGGIGSSQYDTKQATLDKFFRRAPS
jgi:probable phosphoglycerate mutase